MSRLAPGIPTSVAVLRPLAALSALWVPVVYGREFAPAIPLVTLLCLAGIVQSVDYLLVHEVLRTRDARTLLRCRLPGLLAVAGMFLLVRWLDGPVAVLGLAPLVGYAASAASFLAVARVAFSARNRERVAVSA